MQMKKMQKKQHKRKITNRTTMMKKLNKKVTKLMITKKVVRLTKRIQLLSSERTRNQKNRKEKRNQLAKTLTVKTINQKEGDVEEIKEEVATIEETEKEGRK